MPVNCSHCGEPLMGSVNRCWRCGQSLVVVAGEPELPPIRRERVELASVPTASLVDSEVDGNSSADSLPTDSSPFNELLQAPVSPRATDAAEATRDAISATGSSDAIPVEPARRSPVQPKYPKKVFAESCAITSVVVGVLTAFTALLTAWSLIPALVGIVLGIVGLGSERRKTAAVGIAICCAVVLISTARASIWAYRVHERRQLEMMGEF